MCGRRVLRKDSDAYVELKGLPCNMWGCSECSPRKRREVRAWGLAGAPEKVLTLTYDANRPGSSTDHFVDLLHAWDVLLKRMRRRYAPAKIEYMVFPEATKAGEPHLHILLRAPFIDQRWISDQMAELAGSPIVWIEVVKGAVSAVRYLTKYLTKNPARYGNSKRYWMSRGWLLNKGEPVKDRRQWQAEGFRVVLGSFEEHARELISQGFTARPSFDDITRWWKPGCSPEYPTGPPTSPRLGALVAEGGWHAVWRRETDAEIEKLVSALEARNFEPASTVALKGVHGAQA
jgi:hypothetical protein